jgi:hypothetical protein
MSANFNLDSIALLVEFNSSIWTARRLDRNKSTEVVQKASAQQKGAARVTKNLLAGRPELEEITSLVGAARTYVYDNTLPWSNNGQRLLVTTRLPKFDARMQLFKEEFEAKVDGFVSVYPTLITAQAMALGDMFNRAEFPQASEIRTKFAFSFDYLPVPAAGDIRVDIGTQAQEELRERLEHMSVVRVEKAMAEINEKLSTHLRRMADRLTTDTNPDTGEGTVRRFTDTLVSGALELCDLVADYNVTGDATLAQARRQLETALSGVTAQTLRDDPAKREDVRTAVNDILNKFTF